MFTRGNAASANGKISALTLIVPNASNTSLTVANSLPVNSLTTASNSGNASMMIAISLANEIPSYNPSETFTSPNFASNAFIPSSAISSKLLSTRYKSFTTTKISSNTTKSNVTDLTSVNTSESNPEFTAISAIARISLTSFNNSALSVSSEMKLITSNLSATASTTLPKLFLIVSNSTNFSTRLIPVPITSTNSAFTLISLTAFRISPTV